MSKQEIYYTSFTYKNSIDWENNIKPLTKWDILSLYYKQCGELFWIKVFEDNKKDFVKYNKLFVVI